MVSSARMQPCSPSTRPLLVPNIGVCPPCPLLCCDRASSMLQLPRGHCSVPSPQGSCTKAAEHAAGARPGSRHPRNGGSRPCCQLGWARGCQWLPSSACHWYQTPHRHMGSTCRDRAPLSLCTVAPSQARSSTCCQERSKQSLGCSRGDRSPGWHQPREMLLPLRQCQEPQVPLPRLSPRCGAGRSRLRHHGPAAARVSCSGYLYPAGKARAHRQATPKHNSSPGAGRSPPARPAASGSSPRTRMTLQHTTQHRAHGARCHRAPSAGGDRRCSRGTSTVPSPKEGPVTHSPALRLQLHLPKLPWGREPGLPVPVLAPHGAATTQLLLLLFIPACTQPQGAAGRLQPPPANSKRLLLSLRAPCCKAGPGGGGPWPGGPQRGAGAGLCPLRWGKCKGLLLLLGEFQRVAEDLESRLLIIESTCLGRFTADTEQRLAPGGGKRHKGIKVPGLGPGPRMQHARPIGARGRRTWHRERSWEVLVSGDATHCAGIQHGTVPQLGVMLGSCRDLILGEPHHAGPPNAVLGNRSQVAKVPGSTGPAASPGSRLRAAGPDRHETMLTQVLGPYGSARRVLVAGSASMGCQDRPALARLLWREQPEEIAAGRGGSREIGEQEHQQQLQ